MEWEPLVNLLELLSENPKLKTLVQMLSIIVVLAGLYRYLVKPTWNFHWKLWAAADQLIKAIPIILEMAKEFRPNGGNSFRDILSKMNNRQTVIESRMHTLLTMNPGPIFETDQDGLWNWVSPAMSEMTGYMPDQMIGYGWMNLICSDYQHQIAQQWQLAISQRRDAIFEFDLITKADRTIPVKVEITAIKNSSKDISGYIGKVAVVPCSPPSPSTNE